MGCSTEREGREKEKREGKEGVVEREGVGDKELGDECGEGVDVLQDRKQ